jgi:hypothetical protein
MGFFGGWAGKEQCFPLIFTGFGFGCGVVSPCIGQCYGFAENRILNRVGGKQLSMKQKFFGVLALLALAVSCGKKEIPAIEKRSGAAAVGTGLETQAPTALTFDQSFIDMVGSTVNTLGAGVYLTGQLGYGGAYEFIQSATNATDFVSYEAAYTSFQVSQDIVEEYTLTALAASAVFAYLHPEFLSMPDEEKRQYLRQSYVAGMLSEDSRWVRIRQNLENYLQSFVNQELYKADPGWQHIVDCVMDNLYGVILNGATALTLGKNIVDGKVGAAIRSIRLFMKTKTGRAVSVAAALYLMWEMFDCIITPPASGGNTFVRPPADRDMWGSYIVGYSIPYI